MTGTENNEVSITINGVRYDAVEANTEFACEECDLRDLCEKVQYTCLCHIFDITENQCFKKYDKKFEK
jgi:hypothetical protein